VSTREDWMRRLGPLYGGAVALVHSTPWRWPDTLGDEARSAGWLVALGAPIGAVAWVVAALLRAAGMPVAIAAIAGLGMLSLASAAIIERGLVERLEHLSDRTADDRRAPGVPAVLVLVFAILLRAAAILSVAPERWLGVFVATAVVGRWAGAFLQGLGDPILDDATPRSLVGSPPPAWLTAALAVAVGVVAVLALGRAGLVAMAVTAAIAFVLGVDAQRRDRGLSAPVVATVAAVGELAVLLIATLGH
jgi:cobalamin synthase